MHETIDIIHSPRLGSEDWNYAFAAGFVRSSETRLLPDAVFADMAGASGLKEALECVGTGDYGFSNSEANPEQVLLDARTNLRLFYQDLTKDSPVKLLPKIEADMSNLRLALRRFLVGKPIKDDYCEEGTVSPELFEQIFESDDYSDLPPHFRNAIEQAVLSYYETKDIRQVDYAVDLVEFEEILKLADKAKLLYLRDITSVRIDLVNIGMLLRVKFAGKDDDDAPFIDGGFVDLDKFRSALFQSFDVFDQIFYATPYVALIVSAVDYLNNNQSFVRFEALCDMYLEKCCMLSQTVTAGLQPVIAYYYRKQLEIKRLRIAINARKNGLDKQYVSDRLGV